MNIKFLFFAVLIIVAAIFKGQNTVANIDKCAFVNPNAGMMMINTDDKTSVRMNLDGETNAHDWWHNSLDLSILRQHSEFSDARGGDLIMPWRLPRSPTITS